MSGALVVDAGDRVRAATQRLFDDTSPIALTQTVTLKARAFKSGWFPSEEAVGDYTIVSNPLVVTASMSSAPSAMGWNNMPVTVTFTCTDDAPAVTCPGPLQFANEGANQTALVTAHDSLGNQRSLTITVNIDTTAPSVSLADPVDGTSTTADTVLVTGTVTDALSGVATASCNGVEAAIVGGAVQCSVSLRPGVNTIFLQGVDAAGNNVSKGLRVTRTGNPTSLSISPANRKLIVGESQTLVASSEYGPESTVSWVSSDSNVVIVDGAGTIKGMIAGEVTVTGTVGSLTATATVTVLGTPLVPGDVRWSMTNSSSTASQYLGAGAPMVPAHRIDDAGPDFFSVVPASSGGVPFYLIEGFAANGMRLSTETTAATPQGGDIYGGMIAAGSSVVQRIAASATAPPWQYQSSSSAYVASATVQGPDGTVYFVENVAIGDTGQEGQDGYLVGLDGQTGLTKFRTLLPGYTYESRYDSNCEPIVAGRIFRSHDSHVKNLGIGGDGAVYVGLETGFYNLVNVCDYGLVWSFDGDRYPQWYLRHDRRIHVGAGSLSVRSEAKFLRVSPAGSLTFVTNPLAQWSYDGSDALEGYGLAYRDLYMGEIVSNNQQGVFATWAYYDSDGNDTPGFVRLTASGTSILPSSMAPHTFNPVHLTTSSGTAYVWNATTNALEAYDVNSWTRLWTGPTNATAVLETDEGHAVAIQYSESYDSASLVEIDRSGNTLAITQLATTAYDPKAILHGQGSMLGVSLNLGQIGVVVPEYVEGLSYTTRELMYQCREPLPLPPNKGKSLQPGSGYSYVFVGPVWDTLESAKAEIRPAFTKWNNANGKVGLAVAFAAGEGINGDIKTYRTDIGFINGKPIIGGFQPLEPWLPSGHVQGGNLLFTNRTDNLEMPIGFMKVTLHEVGHALGMDDADGVNGSSVMNQLSQGKDDPRNNIPFRPTVCDREAAKEYSTN